MVLAGAKTPEKFQNSDRTKWLVFFLIVSFHLDKSNFQVFVFNSSSQFHGIKEKELTLFNIHFKKKLREKIVDFTIQMNILTTSIC